jgi:hypothetical protein
MATVNLGSIKFKWKGTYSGATAYTIDDVVEYNGSSYICILASTGNLPTNATYFEQMSSAGTNGTNGTDLTTTLTTQGDLVYRDGSGLQRLGAGTAGQVLQTGGAGANPSWGTVSSDFVKIASGSGSSGHNIVVDGYFSATYPFYKLRVWDVSLNGSSWVIGLANFGGSTFTGSNYRHVSDGGNRSSGSTVTINFGEWDGDGTYSGFWDWNNSMQSTTEFTIVNPLSTSRYKTFTWDTVEVDNSNTIFKHEGGAYVSTNQSTAMSGMTIRPETGGVDFTGYKWALYGIK